MDRFNTAMMFVYPTPPTDPYWVVKLGQHFFFKYCLVTIVMKRATAFIRNNILHNKNTSISDLYRNTAKCVAINWAVMKTRSEFLCSRWMASLASSVSALDVIKASSTFGRPPALISFSHYHASRWSRILQGRVCMTWFLVFKMLDNVDEIWGAFCELVQ